MRFPPDRHGDNRWNRALDLLIALWNQSGPDATLAALSHLADKDGRAPGLPIDPEAGDAA